MSASGIAVLKDVRGHEPVTIVEMDCRICANTYGVSPCTASGATKCFNTYATCQDRDNFAAATRTYAFCNNARAASAAFHPDSDTGYLGTVTPTAGNTGGIGRLIPCVVSVSTIPSKIEPGKELGQRESVNIQLQDFPYSDSGLDFYLSDRTYDPASKGTFWGKWRARHPYYPGDTCRIKNGYLEEDANGAPVLYVDNLRTRTYVLERMEGPTDSGAVKFVAKDILKLADDKRAQVPVASKGALAADITAAAGSAELTDATGYGTSGYLRINDEVMEFTRSGTTLTLTDRGTYDTTASEHSEGDSVQECKVYSTTNLDAIVSDLLTTYAGVDASFIDSSAWASEREQWFSGLQPTMVISEPMGVRKILGQLAESCQFLLYWDSRAQLIRFEAQVPPRDSAVPAFDEDDHFKSMTVTENPEERLSQVWVYYGLRSPVADPELPVNYRYLRIAGDEDAESANQYGNPRVRKIFARWLGSTDAATALSTASRLLSKYRDGARYASFRLSPKDGDTWTGDLVDITTRLIQNADGSADSTTHLVVEASEQDDGDVVIKSQDARFFGRYFFIAPDGTPDYGAATDEQRRLYGFIAPDSGVFSDGQAAYKII